MNFDLCVASSDIYKIVLVWKNEIQYHWQNDKRKSSDNEHSPHIHSNIFIHVYKLHNMSNLVCNINKMILNNGAAGNIFGAEKYLKINNILMKPAI